jgi:methyl-accepting chemotaxis protein
LQGQVDMQLKFRLTIPVFIILAVSAVSILVLNWAYDIKTETVTQQRLIVTIGAVVVIAASALVFFIASNFTKSIVTMTTVFKDFSEGKNGINNTLNINTKDEMGELIKYFTLAQEKVKTLVFTVKKETVILAGIKEELAQAAVNVEKLNDIIKDNRSKPAINETCTTKTSGSVNKFYINSSQ